MNFRCNDADFDGIQSHNLRQKLCRSNHSRWLLSSVALFGVLSASSHSLAIEFTVETPTIVTNGSPANILNPNDSLTISPNGSITTTPNNTFGVEATGANNIITNNGSINTSGDDSDGVWALNNNIINNAGIISTTGESSDGISATNFNTITNSGTIVTTERSSDGIDVGDNNYVVNSGSIHTLSREGEGIEVGDDSIVINNGTIITQGRFSEGIEARFNSTIINSGIVRIYDDATGIDIDQDGVIFNSGLIVTTSDGAIGIDSEDGATITNTGSLFTYGNSARGIDGSGDTTVINSGLISTAGTNSIAIDLTGGSTVTNSGKVVAVQSASIVLNVSNNTLNMFAPSFIGGEIDIGTDAIVNITAGSSHSVLWDFSTGTMVGGDPTINGTVPWFYNSTTKQIATFDPSVLAASVESLTDRTALVSATIQRRLEAAELMINGFKRGEPGDYNTGSSTFDKSGVWLEVMASQSEYDGSTATLERDITLGGLAVGYDASINMNTRFGVMAGYIDGSSEAASRWSKSFKGNSSGFFAAGYGRKTFNQLFVDLGLSAGIGTDNETKRFVNDNLAALGESYAMGDGGVSFWISPEVAIGTQIKGPSNWTFVPTAKLRYAAEWLDGYTETGPSADANATVDDRIIAIGEARLELSASRQLHFGSAIHALFTARGGVLGRTSLGDDATITLLGVTQGVSDFYEDNLATFAGMDINFALNELISLDLSTSATVGKDMSTLQAATNVKMSF